jgi:indolepyruvate ferredoxin oxidoreductase, beta subunit
MNFDIYLVGVGGQGVLTIAELISMASQARGVPVNFFASKGMSLRGGAVKAQVRLGRKEVGPSIPERGADLVIALEQSEALKAVKFVKPGGDFVLFADMWATTAVLLGKAPYPRIELVKDQVIGASARLIASDPAALPLFEGQPVSDNVFVLGIALAHSRLSEVISVADVEKTVAERWRKAADRNLFGLRAGVEAKVEIREAEAAAASVR